MRLAIALAFALALIPSLAAQDQPIPAGCSVVTIESPKGDLEVLGDGGSLVVVRFAGLSDAWLGPIPTSALDRFGGGTMEASAGVTMCFALVTPGVGVGSLPTVILSGPQSFSHSAPTLGAAVAGVQAQVKAMMANGWVPVHCSPPTGGTGSG